MLVGKAAARRKRDKVFGIVLDATMYAHICVLLITVVAGAIKVIRVLGVDIFGISGDKSHMC